MSYPECTWIGSAKDSNGQTYAPPIRNVMSYTADSCRSEFTNGQYDRVESFHSLVDNAFVDYSLTMSNDTEHDYNTVTINVTSSHGFVSWNAKVNGVVAGETVTDSAWSNFTHTFDTIPNGEFEVLVRVCYPFTWPEDGSQFCLEKIRWITLTGANVTLPENATITTGSSSSTTANVHTDNEYSNVPQTDDSPFQSTTGPRMDFSMDDQKTEYSSASSMSASLLLTFLTCSILRAL